MNIISQHDDEREYTEVFHMFILLIFASGYISIKYAYESGGIYC